MSDVQDSPPSLATVEFGGPEHSCAAFPLQNNTISIWKVSNSARELFTCTGHHSRVTCIKLNRHVPLLVSGGAKKMFTLTSQEISAVYHIVFDLLDMSFLLLVSGVRIVLYMYNCLDTKRRLMYFKLKYRSAADEGGTCITWCTLNGVAMQAIPLSYSVSSIAFGRSGYCLVATAASAHVHHVEQPTANDLLGLWLDGNRPVSCAEDLTKQLLQTYPNTCNIKAHFPPCCMLQCLWYWLIKYLDFVCNDSSVAYDP